MAEIKTYSHVVEVRDLDKLHQPFGRGQLVGNILQQNTHAERLGECAQMLNRGHRCFELALVKRFAADADVLHQKAKWNLLRYFDRALDLVHGLDAMRPGLLKPCSLEARRRGPTRSRRTWESAPSAAGCRWYETSPRFRARAACGWRNRHADARQRFRWPAPRPVTIHPAGRDAAALSRKRKWTSP